MDFLQLDGFLSFLGRRPGGAEEGSAGGGDGRASRMIVSSETLRTKIGSKENATDERIYFRWQED